MTQPEMLDRLSRRGYLGLVGSFILIVIEWTLRAITLSLPRCVISSGYHGSKSLFYWFSKGQGDNPEKNQRIKVDNIARAHDFVDLCDIQGYAVDEHIVRTSDGYLLGIHRLRRRQEEGEPIIADTTARRVVYLHHGLMMNSEVWVCISQPARCLAFQLLNNGYDVWLGNNRGNKYSKKSSRHSPASDAFWDFSIDQFAFHDIPDTISYILSTTDQPSLSYIGFSQGTAQAFAALSVQPWLNTKIDVFIALAPAISPAGLQSGIVDALVKASPEIIFLAFGRRSLLSSTTMWQSILFPPIFVKMIDMSLAFLFNWTGKNISELQKLSAYPHLYSFTSTKSVVHWFQILRNKSFQMFDDDSRRLFRIAAKDRYYRVPRFPTLNIKTPIFLIYGGCDSLVDIKVMLKQLPPTTIAQCIPHFEHLDFLWGEDLDKLVFPQIYKALQEVLPQRPIDTASHNEKHQV